MSDDWRKVKKIFNAALRHKADKRQEFLDRACADDEVLRCEVESLLASFSDDSFLEQPAIGEVAGVVLEGDNRFEKGEIFSHYKIIKQIGAGGMGEVYLAEDTFLKRQVALKLLHAVTDKNENHLQRFFQEARTASALNHPNILTIHEIGDFDGIYFIAAEYVKGKTLRERLKQESLSLSEALDIAVQIAAALVAAHEAGIIHRDIKPENIILREDGLLKVLDFGLAKLTEKRRGDGETGRHGAEDDTLIAASPHTEPGMILGTVAYMSPEQARGQKVDARTDIWSSGVVLYEMLTRRLPFAGETSSDVFAAILKSEIKPPAKHNPEIPSELERIVLKTLRKNRAKRYQHSQDLLVDLRELKQELEFAAKLERSSSSTPPAKNEKSTVGKVTAVTEIQNAQTVSSAEYIVSEIRKHKRGFAFVSVILLLALGGFGFWYAGNPPADISQIESIAIMPFQNGSGNADAEYLSDGMTESLISSLSQLPRLSVKARSSVFRYKGKEIEIKKIAKEISVQAVLIGRVVQRENDLTLFVELVDAATEKVLWSENYNRPLTNLVVLQNEIARDVSRQLRTKLSGADEQRVTKKYTENTEAYKLYLQGRYLQGRYFSSAQSAEKIKKGIQFYEQAIALDPNYALAYAGIADAYYTLSYIFMPPKEAMPKAKNAALKALEIDDTLSEAHSSLAIVKTFYDWDWPAAESEFKRAIELNPNNSDAHEWYAWHLALIGRADESIAEIKRAQELAPISTRVSWSSGVVLFFAHRYDQAIEQLLKTIEMDSDIPLARFFLGVSYEQKGMYNEAVKEFQKSRLSLVNTYIVSGKRDEGLKLLDEFKDRVPLDKFPPYEMAIIYTSLGEKEQAFEWLEKAFQDRAELMTWLKVDPRLHSLHSDPRFQDLLQRMNFPP